jgi:hypothetical protein
VKGLVPACFSRAVAVYDATLGQIVRRKFDVDAVTWKNFDAMPAQTSGNVGQNYVAVVEFDRERRAWKHLLDAAVNFKRRLFVVDAVSLDYASFCRAIASSDK